MPSFFDDLPNELFQLILHGVLDHYDDEFVKSPVPDLRLVNSTSVPS